MRCNEHEFDLHCAHLGRRLTGQEITKEERNKVIFPTDFSIDHHQIHTSNEQARDDMFQLHTQNRSYRDQCDCKSVTVELNLRQSATLS